MGREKDGLARATAQAVEQLHHLHLAGKIEEGRRFVQVDDGRLLCQCLGYHHLLALAVAQGIHHAVGQVCDAHQGDGARHHLLVCLRQGSPKAGVRAASQTHQLRGGHVTNVAFLRQHHAQHARQLLVRVGINFLALHVNVSVQLGLEGRERAQQGGLPHSVGSQKAGQLAAADVGRNACRHHLHAVLRGIADGEVFDMDGRFVQRVFLY